MSRVVSKDGTGIAYESTGAGPVVLIVGGGIVGRSAYAPLAKALSENHSVWYYDRRGRGESGNTLPYEQEREVEDVAAMVVAAREEVDGPLCLFGISSGGALVLEAAAAGVPADRLVVYEVPYCATEQTARRWQEYVEGQWVALAEGRDGDALELFMRFSGANDALVASARNSPKWAGLAATAYLLAYEAASTGDGVPPVERLATIAQPTLVLTGGVPANARLGMGEMPQDFYARAADAIVAAVPDATSLVLEGQSHEPDPARVRLVVESFRAGDLWPL
jgi:pimeloyl-ACP methyl ester carboxylesterase